MTERIEEICVEDLLDLLPLVDNRGWKLDKSGRIRDRKGNCPLCALAEEVDGRRLYEVDYASFWTLLGVYSTENESAFHAIARAADLEMDSLRFHLEQALGGVRK